MDAAALAGEGHDESRAARHADRTGEAEAEEPARGIAAEFVLNVCRHGPLGRFPPLKPALEVLRDFSCGAASCRGADARNGGPPRGLRAGGGGFAWKTL
jgi:hypothetical protein